MTQHAWSKSLYGLLQELTLYEYWDGLSIANFRAGHIGATSSPEFAIAEWHSLLYYMA
jgi:hypothetical protein